MNSNFQIWERFFAHFKLYSIPVSIGLIYISYQRFRSIRQEKRHISVSEPRLASAIELYLLKFLPLKTCSRGVGYLSTLHVPEALRAPIYSTFCKRYNCTIDEAELTDFRAYRSFGEFFRRALNSQARPIAQGKDIVVSPADGTILYFDEVKNEVIEQVKGVTYSLKSFFGPETWLKHSGKHKDDPYHLKLRSKNSDTKLYQCVIYLAPGDYHRFHSPAKWTINFRRHFSGELIGVKFANWIPGLFHMNERVAYLGEWNHGFFSMTAVGATNVGSIRVYFDEFLKTNRSFWSKHRYDDRAMDSIKLDKGEPFGEFNLGSTIVLIFEAPNDFRFAKGPGDRIKYGELISYLQDCASVSCTDSSDAEMTE